MSKPALSKSKRALRSQRSKLRIPSAPIPALDLSRQYASIAKEVNSVLARVCASQQYILGPEVQHFEQEAANYLGVDHAVACASGTDALWLAMLAAGIGPGDEVITTPFTFFATGSAIARIGARPVFVDIEDNTLNISPAAVEQRIARLSSSRLKAILPVHLYGQCADMEALNALGMEHKLAVIEDAAQAFGATWQGRSAGALGTLGTFSFYPTKNLSCYGDGGMVTCNDSGIADHLRRLRAHGSRKRYYHEELGWNSRLDSLQAAVLRVKLKYISDWNKRRNARAKTYDSLLASAGLLPSSRKDRGSAPIRLLSRAKEGYHIYHQYVVRAERRGELRAFLSERRIGTEIYYPVPLHLQECFAYLGYAEGELPIAEQASREVLALPMFPELTAEEQQRVIAAVADFYS